MGSRTWIKIYCEKWLTGTLRKESRGLRGTWTDVLALAGSSLYGDIGLIALPNNIGLTDDQIARILEIDLETWGKDKQRLIDSERIEILNDNVIKVINFPKYQGEYERQKKYRKKSDNEK